MSEVRGQSRRYGHSIAKFVFRPGEVADVGDRACAIDVAAQFFRIAFAYEDAAIAPGGTRAEVLGNFSRRAIVVTDFINRVQSIYTSRKMQRGHVNVGIKLQILSVQRAFARRDDARMTAASARTREN